MPPNCTLKMVKMVHKNGTFHSLPSCFHPPQLLISFKVKSKVFTKAHKAQHPSAPATSPISSATALYPTTPLSHTVHLATPQKSHRHSHSNMPSSILRQGLSICCSRTSPPQEVHVLFLYFIESSAQLPVPLTKPSPHTAFLVHNPSPSFIL